MKFTLQTATGVSKLLTGNYKDINEVYKLRIFKDNPSWKAVPVEEILESTAIVPMPMPISSPIPQPLQLKLKLKLPKISHHKQPKTIVLRRKELRQVEAALIVARAVRITLVKLEKSAKRLFNSDHTCGLHSPATDYWIPTSIALDCMTSTVAKLVKRKKELLAMNKTKHL